MVKNNFFRTKLSLSYLIEQRSGALLTANCNLLSRRCLSLPAGKLLQSMRSVRGT